MRWQSTNHKECRLIRVGIDLADGQFFDHGQCYVAMSRVTNPENLYVRTVNGVIKNIICKQLLCDPDEENNQVIISNVVYNIK